MRTNEEFKAEIYRRKEEKLQKSRVLKKNIISVILCVPFGVMAFLGLSLATGRQAVGSSVTSAQTSLINTGAEKHCIDIRESDEYGEELRVFFEKIETRSPEVGISDANMKGQSYKTYIGYKVYFVYENYVRTNGQYFAITENEFAEFLNIIKG